MTTKIRKVHLGLLRRGSEMRVGFLLNQSRQAKTALENAEVSSSIVPSLMYSYNAYNEWG